MALLYRRPLAAGCIVLIIAVIAALTSSLLIGWILLCAALLAFAVLLVLFCRRSGSYRRFSLLILALAAVIGLGRVQAQRSYRESVIKDRLNTDVTATLTVEEILYRSSYRSALLVAVEDLNGEACKLTAVMTVEALSPFGLGDRITGSFYAEAIQSAATESAERSTFLAKDACLVLDCRDPAALRLLESGNGSAASMIDDFRYKLHHRVATAVGGEAGDLMGALLLGTRDGLESDTVRDFRRAGLSHLLALSGLHLAILVKILEWTLRRLRIGKRGITVVLSIFCLIYLALTGFSYSMLRAVIMLLMLQASFWFKRDHDTLTALSIGGAGIVAITPAAVYSLSFQMTMLATLGILAFGNLQERLLRCFPVQKSIRGVINRALRFVISTILVTLAATLMLLPVQWLTFGELALIAPLANLPAGLLMLPLLTIGMLLLMLALFGIPMSMLALPARLPAQALLWLTGRLSETDTVLSLRYDFVPFICIPLLALTALLLLVQLKKRLQPLAILPALAAIVAFIIAVPITHAVGRDEIKVIYRTSGKDDGLLLLQNDKAMLCDLSSGSLTQLKKDYALLQESGACEVDVLLLTHYHKGHRAALAEFCRSVRVREIWLPLPENEQDKSALADILAMAIDENVPITVYVRGAPLTVFETGQLTVSPVLTDPRSTEPAFAVSLAFGDDAIRYETASYAEYLESQGLPHEGSVSHLILGSHGPRPHAVVDLPDWEVLEEVWISSEQVALYTTPREDLRYVICPSERDLVLE